ncbi:MAG: ribosome maturation factor RimM [Acidimicrobiales bacterium]
MGLLEVGRITTAHGVRGDVIVELTTNRAERVAAGSILESDCGSLTVARSTPHQGRWIVTFKGVEGRTAAEGLRGVTLRAEPIADPDSLWVHELIGSRVVDTAGVERGTVVSVVANPASDLLELDSGALVPLRFIVPGPAGQVTVDPPAGLFDLS